MVIGLGTDIVENRRIRQSLDRFGTRFLDRVYHQEEREYCLKKKDPIPSLAARFAAKEAFVKAMSLGPGQVIPFKDVHVAGLAPGKKKVRLTGVAESMAAGLKVKTIHLSISHGRDFSYGTIVLEN